MKKGTKVKVKIKKKDPLAGDMSDFIRTAKWRKVKFVFPPKDATVTIRMTRGMVDMAKKVAKKKGVKYHRMMRDAIVDYVLKAA